MYGYVTTTELKTLPKDGTGKLQTRTVLTKSLPHSDNFEVNMQIEIRESYKTSIEVRKLCVIEPVKGNKVTSKALEQLKSMEEDYKNKRGGRNSAPELGVVVAIGRE